MNRLTWMMIKAIKRTRKNLQWLGLTTLGVGIVRFQIFYQFHDDWANRLFNLVSIILNCKRSKMKYLLKLRFRFCSY